MQPLLRMAIIYEIPLMIVSCTLAVVWLSIVSESKKVSAWEEVVC